jgi:hypothetical protein
VARRGRSISSDLNTALFLDEVYLRLLCFGKNGKMYWSSELIHIDGTTNRIGHTAVAPVFWTEG